MQESINTRRGVERCLRYAFEFDAQAQTRDKKLTLCGKTNVLTFAFDLWERAFHEIGQKDFPDIKRDYAHVDATTMWFVKNPEWFDVIVTDNMFGDIITDLGAMIQGGMGIAAGGNINPERHEHVRADRRHRAEIHRPERDQSAGGHLRRPDDARFPRRTRSGEGHRKGRDQDHARKNQEPRGGQDGLLDVAGRRHGRGGAVVLARGRPPVPLLHRVDQRREPLDPHFEAIARFNRADAARRARRESRRPAAGSCSSK